MTKELQERVNSLNETVKGFSGMRQSRKAGVKASLTKLESDVAAKGTDAQKTAVAAMRLTVGESKTRVTSDATADAFAQSQIDKCSDTSDWTDGTRAARKAWLKIAANDQATSADMREKLEALYKTL